MLCLLVYLRRTVEKGNQEIIKKIYFHVLSICFTGSEVFSIRRFVRSCFHCLGYKLHLKIALFVSSVAAMLFSSP